MQQGSYYKRCQLEACDLTLNRFSSNASINNTDKLYSEILSKSYQFL
jgi:hypothetical protein